MTEISSALKLGVDTHHGTRITYEAPPVNERRGLLSVQMHCFPFCIHDAAVLFLVQQ